MVGIERQYRLYQEGPRPPEIVLSMKNLFLILQRVYSRYCQVSKTSLLDFCYHSQTLSKLFLKMELGSKDKKAKMNA